jgi:hypothetical protein
VLLGGVVLCWRGGRSKGRLLAQPAADDVTWLERHAWPRSLGLGATWGMAVLGAGLLATLGPDWGLPAGQRRHHAYGAIIAMFDVLCMSVLAVAVGFMIAQMTAVITRSRTKKGPGVDLR